MAPLWWSRSTRRVAAATIAAAGAAASLAAATSFNAVPPIISDNSASPSPNSTAYRASPLLPERAARRMSHVASCEGSAADAGSIPAVSGESANEATRAGGGEGGGEGENAPGVGGAGHQAGSAAIFPLKLLQVHVMFRHGDRAPMPRGTPSEEEVARWEARLQPRPPPHILPHRQHTRGIEWPFGQLTRKGAREAESLGCALRQRYAALLGLEGAGLTGGTAGAAADAAGDAAGAETQAAAEASEAVHDSNKDSSNSGSSTTTGSSSNSTGASPAAASSLIKIRSTNFPRTYMTGFYVLQGLLGSQERAAQVPIGIWGEEDENLYENDRCARGVMLWGRAWKDLSRSTRNPDGSFTDAGWRAQYQNVRESMRSFFNLPAGRFPWLWAVDYADCRRHHGDPLPPALNPPLLDTFRYLLAQDYMRTFSHQEICRLSMGPLLHEVHESMKAAIALNAAPHTPTSNSSSSSSSAGYDASPALPTNTAVDSHARPTSPPPSDKPAAPSTTHTPTSTAQPASVPSTSSVSFPSPSPSPHPRILLYSGHDATLMPLSAALGRPFPFWPGYASSIALELWASQDNSTHFVRVLRNFEEVDMPRQVPPAGGSWLDMPAAAAAGAAGAGGAGDGIVLCPWEHFSRILEWSEISKDHYERDCHVAKPRL
ncbi:hypothetical protein CLOM_g22114 [Closterium sp. NIES-68]|nr:hypothetical protein CLOM_g22114 [Closterium sp. NIES-68]GJP74460.1 hypothetical protein CLOP_g5037 [Closterium sp. NIES-67]